jgi:hypothetical protein
MMSVVGSRLVTRKDRRDRCRDFRLALELAAVEADNDRVFRE